MTPQEHEIKAVQSQTKEKKVQKLFCLRSKFGDIFSPQIWSNLMKQRRSQSTSLVCQSSSLFSIPLSWDQVKLPWPKSSQCDVKMIFFLILFWFHDAVKCDHGKCYRGLIVIRVHWLLKVCKIANNQFLISFCLHKQKLWSHFTKHTKC